MSASVSYIDCIGTLYSCVYNPVSSISCGSFISRSFPGSDTGMHARIAIVALYWHDLILWPQISDHRPAEKVSEWIRSTTESVCLTSRWHACTWQVTEIARRAQRALQYGTEAARAADMYVCGIVVNSSNGASIRLHVLYAPGRLVTHWLACPAHKLRI